MGRNLDYDPKKVFELKDPGKAMLPKTNISSRYIFALNKDYLVYQNNYNHFAGILQGYIPAWRDLNAGSTAACCIS